MTRDELKARQQALGMTQAALASALQVAGSTIRNWEQGVHAIPDWVAARIGELEIAKKGGG